MGCRRVGSRTGWIYTTRGGVDSLGGSWSGWVSGQMASRASWYAMVSGMSGGGVGCLPDDFVSGEGAGGEGGETLSWS